MGLHAFKMFQRRSRPNCLISQLQPILHRVWYRCTAWFWSFYTFKGQPCNEVLRDLIMTFSQNYFFPIVAFPKLSNIPPPGYLKIIGGTSLVDFPLRQSIDDCFFPVRLGKQRREHNWVKRLNLLPGDKIGLDKKLSRSKL